MNSKVEEICLQSKHYEIDNAFIFNRFYKVDKAHKEEGAGLGLSIAKEVIMRMNGNIHAKSDKKNETCFSFEIESDY